MPGSPSITEGTQCLDERNLGAYGRLAQAVAESVRSLERILAEHGNARGARRCRDLLDGLSGGRESEILEAARIGKSLARLHEVILTLIDGLVSVPAEENPDLSSPSGAGFAAADFGIEVSPEPSAELIAQTLRGRGCPVCDWLAQKAFEALARLQYGLAHEESVQQRYAAGGGLCPRHTWQLASVASPYGLSRGLPRFLEEVGRRLEGLGAPGARRADSLLDLVQSGRDCPLCRLLRRIEESYVSGLVAFLEQPEGRKAYEGSQGVCLRHLAILVEGFSCEEMKRWAVAHATRRLNEMAEDMRRYTAKRDAQRRADIGEDEKDAYLRALSRVVGGRAVALPWEGY